MKQEQMKIWERFLKGLLIMTGILFYSNWNWIFIPVSWIFRRKYHYCIHFRGSDHCNHYGQQRMERMLFAAQCVVV